METKHTPGPWKFAHDSDDLIVHDGEDVAYVDTLVNNRPKAEQRANARLIAAAPDQIAELIRIEARVAASMPTKHDDLTAASVTFTGADLAKLRAIIAKATK